MGDIMGIVGRLQRVLLRGDLSRGVGTLVFGTGIGQVIVVVTSPLLTRLYSPSEVGAYSAAASILAVLVTVTCLRFEFAIPLPEADVDAANILALSLVVALAMSAASGLVLWMAGPWLLTTLRAPALGPFVLLLAVGQFGGGVFSALTSWAIRTKSFSDMAATRLTQVGTLVAIQLGLGVVGLGSVGLLIGDVAGRFSGSGRLGRSAWRSHAESFRSVSRRGIRFAATRYRRFPIFSSWSVVLNALGEQAPLLLLVVLYGPATGGQFALAQRVSAVPVALFSAAVGQVFFAQAARLARDQPDAMLGVFKRTTRSLAVTAVGPFVAMAVIAPVLAGPAFGRDWAQAGVFVTILAPMYYMQFVMSSTGSTLDVLERQDLHLARELLRLGLVGGAVLISAALSLPAVGAVVVLSAAGCVTYAFYGFVSWRAIISSRSRRGSKIDGTLDAS